MSSTGQFASSGDSSSAHNGTLIVLLHLHNLVTLAPLALSGVTLAVCTCCNSNLGEVTLVTHTVVMLTLSDSVPAQHVVILANLRCIVALTLDTSTIVLIRVPVSIAEVISVTGDPSVDTLSFGSHRLVEVRTLLVITVKGDLGSVGNLLALRVILNNLPVLFYRDIDITELDLSLLFLLNLGELLPLEGQDQTVTASWINIGNDPDVLDVGGDYLFEGFKSKLLLICPVARRLLSLYV